MAFVIAACREFDSYVRSTILSKMMGDLDESAAALLTVTTNCIYGMFEAIRLAGATWATIFLVMAINFFFHIKYIPGNGKWV